MKRRLTHAAQRLAAVQDRKYLESLNLKALQKDRKPTEDQSKREFYQGLQEQAKGGPLFDSGTLNLVERLPALPKPVTKWLANLSAHAGMPDIDPRGLNLIIDWVKGDREAKIEGLTWDQAMVAQQAWHEAAFEVQDTVEYTTKDVVQDFGDGWTMVEVTDREDLQTEGNLMGHCVGGDDYWNQVKSGKSKIYSLRDPGNKPHVTIEVSGGEVQQCFGKQNAKPVKKYNKYLIEFFAEQDLLDGLVHLEDTSKVPEDIWRKLVNHESFDVRSRVAANPSTPVAVLKVLAQDSDISVRCYVAQNPSTPVEVLKVLAQDSSMDVRCYVAKQPSTPVVILKVLAQDSHIPVRWCVAANPSTPVAVLKVLAQDSNMYVRRDVAQNPSTPVEVLKVLAQDSSMDVRGSAAINPSTPVEVLKVLAQDSSMDVRYYAVRALNSRGITAAVKDREYLESLNLKQLQKTQKPTADQDKREFYQSLQEQAKEGPVFDPDVLALVEGLEALPKHVTKWLATLATKHGLDHINPRELTLIVDWAKADPDSAKIQNMTWEQALATQQAWHDSQFEVHDAGDYNTKDVVYKFKDGWTVVTIKDEYDLDTEGNLMGHCVGGDHYWDAVDSGRSEIFSLRDPQNKPHVTMEYTGGQVRQCFGKQNEHPVKKYHPYLVEFFVNYLHSVAEVGKHRLVVPESMYKDLLNGSGDAQILLASQENLPESMMHQLVAIGKKTENTQVLVEIAARRNLPEKIKLELLALDDTTVWSALMRYDNLDEATQLAIIDKYDYDDDMRSLYLALAASKYLKVLRKVMDNVLPLAGDDMTSDRRNPHGTVLSAIVSNVHTPQGLLVEMAYKVRNGWVANQLVRTGRIPEAAVLALIPVMEDVSLVLNEHTDPETIEAIIKKNDSLSDGDLIDYLYSKKNNVGPRNRDKYVRDLFKRNSTAASSGRRDSIMNKIATNTNLPDVLLALAKMYPEKSGPTHVQQALARNTALPPEAARLLMNVGNIRVDTALFNNKNVPQDVKDLVGARH